MSLSMYQASVPVFVRSMTNLQAILDKGAKYAEAKKFEPSVLINARLAPDMFPLSRQVQGVSDLAKGAGARLAGIEVPNMPDTETTFPELHARLQRLDLRRNFRRHLRRLGRRGTGRLGGDRRCGGKGNEKRKQKSREKQERTKKKTGSNHGVGKFRQGSR